MNPQNNNQTSLPTPANQVAPGEVYQPLPSNSSISNEQVSGVSEILESPDQNSPQASLVSDGRSSRRRLIMRQGLIVLGALVVTVLAASVFTAANRHHQAASSALKSNIPAQNVNISGSQANTSSPIQLQSGADTLIVNGDLVGRGSFRLYGQQFYGQLQPTNLAANRNYRLPNASGTICLDSNNCNFATSTQLNQVAQAAILPGTVTLQGNTFNGAGELVQLTNGGLLPVLNGSNLTNVNAATLSGHSSTFYTNASNLSSGTLSDNRLSTNVALLSGTGPQIFTGNNEFSGTVLLHNAVDSATAFQIQDAAGNSNLLIANTSSGRIGIGKAPTQGKLDVNGAIFQNGNAVCDTSGNCGGGSGGGLGGGGTTDMIPIWTSASSLGDSLLSQSGSTVTSSGNLNVTGQYQVNGSQISSANLSNDSNLAKLNGSGPQIFTGNNKFSGTFLAQNSSNSSTAFQIQNAAGTSNLLIADTTATKIGIGKAPTLGTLDVNGAIYQSGNQVCDTSGNCVGTGGGGAVGGSGTANTIALFTGSGFTIGNSNLVQSGSTITNTGTFNSTTALQTNGTTRIDSSGNLSNIGNLSLSGTISGGTTYSGSGNINTTGGALQTNSTTRVDNSGNLTNVANLTTTGASTFTAGGSNGFTVKAGTDNTAVFQVQNTSSAKSIFTVDSTNNQAILGNSGASGITGKLKVNFSGSTGSTTITIANPGSNNFTATIPTLGANDTFCFATLSNCSATGSAGGDLSGSYPNPTVAKINGVSLGSTTATSGNLLIADGTQWVSQPMSGDATITSGGILTIATGAVTSAKILDNTITNNDLSSGSYSNITGTGALSSGSIASGFGTISTNNTITGTTVTGTSGAVFGVASSTTGTALFRNASGSGSISLSAANPGSSNFTLTLPAENGTLCSTGSVCSGYAPSSGSTTYATRQLDNLTGVAINTSLLPGSSNSIDLGDATHLWRTGLYGTSVLTPLLDTPSGTTTLNIGTNNATAGISLNQNTSISGSNTFTTGTGAVALNGNTAVSSNKSFTASGSALFEDATNSSTAFQVQNSSGTNAIAVDTTTYSSLITNAGFENSTIDSGWAALGSAGAPARATDITMYQGVGGLKSAWGTTNGNGFKYNYTFANAVYSLSFKVRLTAGTTINTTTGLVVGFNDGSNHDCTLSPTPTSQGNIVTTSNGWVSFSCSSTTLAAGAGFVYWKENDSAGSARTVYLDNVNLTQAPAASQYQETALQLNGSVNAPALFQPTVDSNSSFQIQNAAGTGNIFVVDSINKTIGIDRVPNPFYFLDVGGQIAGDSGFVINNTATNTGSIQKTATSAGVSANDVVIMNSSSQVADTTTARDSRIYGVATSTAASTSTVAVAIGGNYSVNCTGTVNAGDQLVTSTVSGAVATDNSATTGILGTALGSCSSGKVDVSIRPVNGQYSPIFRNASDSTTAFQVQNATGTSNLFIADTTNTVIKIATSGTATQSGTNLFVGGAAEVSGALRVGDGTNNVQFDGTTHEITFNGNARHTRRVFLAPEYAGATLTGDGTNNTGTMTSDNMTSSPFRNYYKWTTSQGSNQDYDIWVRVMLPSDFSAMAGTPTLSMDTYTSDTTNGTISVTVYDTSNSADCTAASMTPGSTTTWTTSTTTTCLDTGTYAANGVMTFDIHLQSPQSGDVRVSNFYFDYLSKW